MTQYVISSPVGPLTLTQEGDALTGLVFGGTVSQEPAPTELLRETQRQLDAYFAGKLKGFTIPLSFGGTEFQHAVWAALLTIPYGGTSTYGAIARQIGRPKAVRAVGHTIGLNPISILIPCHRVLGKNGSLTGFAWGLDAKQTLLTLEGHTLR